MSLTASTLSPSGAESSIDTRTVAPKAGLGRDLTVTDAPTSSIGLIAYAASFTTAQTFIVDGGQTAH